MQAKESFTFKRDKENNGKSVMSLNIPLPVACTILGIFVTCSIWLFGQLWAINAKLDAAGADRWKRSYQREWVNRFSGMNPTVKVPNPDQVAKEIDFN